MSASRKGLRRHGLRDYIIPARNGAFIIIHKESKTRWRIRPADIHSAFFYEQHSLLRDARKAAEALAGNKKAWAPVLDLQPPTNRRKRKNAK